MNALITYNTEDTLMPDICQERICRWVVLVAAQYEKRTGTINYIFTSDKRILEVNRKFLQHDYYTDIITFDYSRGHRINGDIYISLDTTRSNAEERNLPYAQELLRVIIHGILHLCGINDKGPGEREIMEGEENRALALWDKMDTAQA